MCSGMWESGKGRTVADMDQQMEEEERAQLQPLLTWSQPLISARWANVELPELMTMLGVPLAMQRLEAPGSRERIAMQNQQATYMMIDPETGLAHPHWQHSIGEVLVYRCPTPSTNEVMVGHLTLFDMDVVMEFISGELGCGETLSEDPITPDNLTDYRQRWEEHVARMTLRKLEEEGQA